MGEICKAMKEWGNEDKLLDHSIVDKFCTINGDVMTFNFKDKDEYEKIRTRIKITLKSPKNEKIYLENLFLKTVSNNTEFEYNFAISESKNGINEIGNCFLDNRILKIDNGKGKIKILKNPDPIIYVLNQRIKVIFFF